jgi:flagellar hook-associated protein 2
MGSSSFAPITFTGASSFSSSLQQVLNRSLQIAALPMQAMQNKVTDLTNQQSALNGLESSFAALQTAISNMSAAAGGTVSASVSNSSIVSASTTSAAVPGTYSIEVDDLGSYTTALSNAGSTAVTDPNTQNLSSSSNFTLTVNGAAHSISPSGNSLSALAAAINQAGYGVQATVVNVGSSSATDYRLSLTSTELGADTVQLNDGNSDLMSTLSTGAEAQYKVGGLSTQLQSTSRQVTLSPGLTVNLLQAAPGQTVTVTAAKDTSLLSSTLSSLANAYNAAMTALGQQRGQNAGALSGQSIVYSLTNTLQTLSGYTGPVGGVSSLADLGLTVDETGQMSFDPTVFNNANKSDLQAFLGSATTSGFLKVASDAITQMSDPTNGMIQADVNSIQGQITAQNSKISDETARLTDLQTTLQQQLANADAAIASLESQKTYFNNLFIAENSLANSMNGSSSSGG